MTTEALTNTASVADVWSRGSQYMYVSVSDVTTQVLSPIVML